MKRTNKFLTLILTMVAAIAITSCVQDDDYTIPSSLGQDENDALTAMLATATEVDMAYVKALYIEDGEGTVPFHVENDVYVKGYVSSSDKSGNFFKEFFLQDAPSNPTGALKITIDQVDTYNQYNQGREVYIYLKGLYIGEERVGNGITTIGGGTEFDQYGGTVTRVNENQFRDNILRSDVTEEMVPLEVTFATLTDEQVGVFVQINGVQFADNLAGERYFDAVQVYDTQRTLQACDGFTYSNMSLETSSFANFKEHLLPEGNGSIKAIVNKTFDGSTRILALNAVEDVDMEATRCSPLDLDEFEVVYEEDFVGGLNGWNVINTDGSQEWYPASFGGVSYVRGSGYDGSNAVTMVSWLISPSFDFDAQADEKMVLEIADAFSDAGEEPLKAYYSTDYVAGSDPSTGTWVEVGAAQIEALPINGGFFDNVYDATNFIDLSGATGTGFIAFVYDSNDAAISSTRDLGNVKILAP
ncbi:MULTISPECIES: DUF5689 domain-containing protein [unclassified Lacinutrix]